MHLHKVEHEASASKRRKGAFEQQRKTVKKVDQGCIVLFNLVKILPFDIPSLTSNNIFIRASIHE